MQALVPLELVLGPEVWLALSVLASWPSMLANCLLVLLLWQGFDYEWVEEVGLLAVKLVIVLVTEASSQVRIIVYRDNTWSRNRWSYPARLNGAR